MTLHVLLVEDSPADEKLIAHEIRKQFPDSSITRVDDEENLRKALSEQQWDVILSDWSLPKFGGLGALGVVKTLSIDAPFIIVSGTVGEETAVGAMRAGAHDYVLKDRLTRLCPVIERELRETAERKARREAEAALRESETRFRCLAESGLVGIVITDETGRITEANAVFLSWIGYTSADLKANRLDWKTLTPPDYAERADQAWRLLQAEGIAKPWESECIGKGGQRVPVLIGATALQSGSISVVSDLSERRRAEETMRKMEAQLRQSQKMEAIGSLAGGVAHDFNNLLTVILSYSELLKAGLKPDDPMYADLELIRGAGDRAASLTRQLLAFSRQQVLQPRQVSFKDIIDGLEKMIRRLIGEDIELTIFLSPLTPQIHADPGQLEQVLLNLVINSRDAMPKGGKITVETAPAELDDHYAEQHLDVTPGAYALLAVTDTGSGMDEATRARIFEPFFTTKGIGQGTGLGLSTVFGIVKQSGGHISVYSELGRGTTMKVYMPRNDKLTHDAPTPANAKASLRGSETILLVEDEDLVRDVTATILRRQGYHVLEAENGGAALLICEQHTARVDLLLTDVIMPRMSGRELAERLCKLRPDMPVLYMSGYTNNAIVQHGVLDSHIEFLQKPLTPERLIKKVREVLDAAKPPG